jgi:hypothetical protein
MEGVNGSPGVSRGQTEPLPEQLETIPYRSPSDLSCSLCRSLARELSDLFPTCIYDHKK